MAESGQFAVDSPVAPVGVLASESDDEFADLGFDWWSAPLSGSWLGPVSGGESSVPSDHRVWSDDEERLGEASAVEHPGQQDEDGWSVSVDFARSVWR